MSVGQSSWNGAELLGFGAANQSAEEMPSRVGYPALPAELCLVTCGFRHLQNPILWFLWARLAWRLPSCWELSPALAECAEGGPKHRTEQLEEPGNLCTEPGSDQNMS